MLDIFQSLRNEYQRKDACIDDIGLLIRRITRGAVSEWVEDVRERERERFKY